MFSVEDRGIEPVRVTEGKDLGVEVGFHLHDGAGERTLRARNPSATGR